MKSVLFGLAALIATTLPGSSAIGQTQDRSSPIVSAEEVLAGVRQFFVKTGNADGSFRPGVDHEYEGISDSAFSDLAPVTYAVTLHKTFGWKLPDEEKTRAFLLSRQKEDGAFFNVNGTGDPSSPLARLYNTTQGVVALHALGSKPRHDPLIVFAEVLKKDYRSLPPYSTSFFPLAYLACGRSFPAAEDVKIRALMVQGEDGYLNNHVAATFHMVHYYRLLHEAIPKGNAILKRVLHDQKADGSWLLNPPARDRHATFDAMFLIRQLGGNDPKSRKAMENAARWALSCCNPDGGFGHFPGCTSDADAVYFQVGTLVLARFLKPIDPLPKDPQVLSWGHLMPPP
jgi:geranylgeranyl transferase type-2 subunit beta